MRPDLVFEMLDGLRPWVGIEIATTNTTRSRKRLAGRGEAVFRRGAVSSVRKRKLGFGAVYMTGEGTAAERGFPDVGLLTQTEMVQNARYIAKAVSEVRQFGPVWAEINGDNMTVARIAVRIGNELPRTGSVPNAESDRLLRLAVGHETTISPSVLKSARNFVALCQRRSKIMPMRRCLEGIHDQVMRSLNGKYWSATSPNS